MRNSPEYLIGFAAAFKARLHRLMSITAMARTNSITCSTTATPRRCFLTPISLRLSAG